MPWKICNLMDARLGFVEDYERGGVSLAELCRRHGISRKTGYKWLERHRLGGLEGLADQSRRPRHSPHRTSEEVERAVIRVRKEHPVWGGRKIRAVLKQEGLEESLLPAASTITGILRRHDLLGEGMREGAKSWQRFSRSEPNDLWQMDFKGHFGMDGGRRCHPLTVLDDHSRYNLVLQACATETRREVQGHLVRAFRRYGLPREILCDWGSPWGKPSPIRGQDPPTPRMEVWLNRLGVRVVHGRPSHPQTQGKEERFHRTLSVEVLRREELWRDLAHCQRAFEKWSRVYNQKRPHEALGMQTPSSCYELSARSYPEHLPDPESFYLEDDELRRVKSKGELTFRGQFYSVGSAYVGELLALRPLEEGRWEVYHCWRSLGVIDQTGPKQPKSRYQRLKPPLGKV